jgi:hypothetical protein
MAPLSGLTTVAVWQAASWRRPTAISALEV